jgi:hypothetical protein
MVEKSGHPLRTHTHRVALVCGVVEQVHRAQLDLGHDGRVALSHLRIRVAEQLGDILTAHSLAPQDRGDRVPLMPRAA